MKYSKYLILSFLVVLLLLILGSTFYQPEGYEKVEEEAIPIRENEVIIGMDYRVHIKEYVNDSVIVLSSHILDSIVHYMELDSIDHFLIRLKIESFHSAYSLKDIYIIDSITHVVIEKIFYEFDGNDSVIFFLGKNYFQKYESSNRIQIELKK